MSKVTIKTIHYFSILAIIALGFVFLPAQKTLAAHDGARLIDNNVFLNANSMNIAGIQNFLANKNSGLASRSFVLNCYAQNSKERQWYTAVGAPCDQNVPASQIIYYVGKVYGVNPQVIMATMQKEQSVITAPNPAAWQLNQAMGYACPTTGDCDSNSSFFWQLDNGTWALRYHYERANGNNTWWNNGSYTCANPSQFYKPGLWPGLNVTFYDGNGTPYRSYTLVNAATAAFYCYTPHTYNNPQGIYGNPAFGSTGIYYSGWYNFVTAFESWFGATTSNSQPWAWSYEGQWAYADANRTIPFTSVPTTTPGGTIYVRVKARNMGTQTWSQSFLRIAPARPMDTPSIFADNSWVSNTRAANMLESSVAPGQIGTFEFALKAPTTTGTYNPYFNLVADGRSWLNDLGLFFTVNVNSSVSPPNNTDTVLNSGNEITTDKYLLSPDAQSTLTLQKDGNVVLYSNFGGIWQTGAFGSSAKRLVMQGDGNLVLYNQSNQPLWNSETGGNPGARLVLQTDGNMVIYNANNAAVWASYTVHTPEHLSYVNTFVQTGRVYPGQSIETADRKYKLILQKDGNLVLYSPSRALWATGTDGKSVSFLAMQADGNLVLYDKNANPLWYSRTSGYGLLRLVIQQDGNVVLYNGLNQPFWHTGTSGQQ